MYGGSPESAGDQPPRAEIFKYEHPHTSYTVDLVVTSTGKVQCPGCGQEKVQLKKHMMTDKTCSPKFEGKIDFESFDDQLKSFRLRKRVQRSKAKSRAENEEEFLEKKRQEESNRKAKKRQENEEEFLEKKRQEESNRKAKKRQENEEEFLEKKRQQERKRKAQRKEENEEDFKEYRRQEAQSSKAKKRKIDEEGFLEQNRQVKRKSRAKISEKQRGEHGRARKFRRAVMLGDIFVCSSCER